MSSDFVKEMSVTVRRDMSVVEIKIRVQLGP